MGQGIVRLRYPTHGCFALPVQRLTLVTDLLGHAVQCNPLLPRGHSMTPRRAAIELLVGYVLNDCKDEMKDEMKRYCYFVIVFSH